MATTRPLPTIPAPAPRRSSWLLRLLFALVVLCLGAELLTLGAMVAFAALTWNDHTGATAPPVSTPASVAPGAAPSADAGVNGRDVWDRHGPVNILLLGMDRDICEGADPKSKANRTDTMILVRVDPRTAKVTMMNLPRDLVGVRARSRQPEARRPISTASTRATNRTAGPAWSSRRSGTTSRSRSSAGSGSTSTASRR
ncbi:MAG: hypothetical protein U0470_10025 [Anaerolineae bacterium]